MLALATRNPLDSRRARAAPAPAGGEGRPLRTRARHGWRCSALLPSETQSTRRNPCRRPGSPCARRWVQTLWLRSSQSSATLPIATSYSTARPWCGRHSTTTRACAQPRPCASVPGLTSPWSGPMRGGLSRPCSSTSGSVLRIRSVLASASHLASSIGTRARSRGRVSRSCAPRSCARRHCSRCGRTWTARCPGSRRSAQGLHREVVIAAARALFRPLLMLIVVAMLGMVPVALARGIGSAYSTTPGHRRRWWPALHPAAHAVCPASHLLADRAVSTDA